MNIEKDMLETLYGVFQKVIRANLYNDSYVELKLAEGEPNSKFASISRWLVDFAENVAPEDRAFYLEETNFYYLKDYFQSNNTKVITYDRVVGECGRRRCKMRMTASAAQEDIIYITIYDAEDEVVKENLAYQSLEDELMSHDDFASIGVIAIDSPSRAIKRHLPINKPIYEFDNYTILIFYDFTPEQLQMNYMSITKAFPDLAVGHCWGTPDELNGMRAVKIAIGRAR